MPITFMTVDRSLKRYTPLLLVTIIFCEVMTQLDVHFYLLILQGVIIIIAYSLKLPIVLY